MAKLEGTKNVSSSVLF